MKHSVYCRAEEITEWYGLEASAAADVLSDDYDALASQISGATLPPRIRTRANTSIAHLPAWVEALRATL
jgi:hypothetical protein